MNPPISKQELNHIRAKMLQFAELQLHNREQAEDLVQEAFLSAFKHLHHFKREAAFKTWVFAILKNKIIDYLRQKGRLILESELDTEDSMNPFFDESGHWQLDNAPSNLKQSEDYFYSEEFWVIFEACLTCLPAKQARVFMMREFLELSSNEICHELSLTTANLHTMLYRARLQLQHCLSQKL